MNVVSDKFEEIKSAAENLYQARPDWVKFYREILGLRGMVRRFCPTPEEIAQFEQSEVCRQIRRMLADLRKRPASSEEGDEDTRVITVRIPQSMHDALRIEAFERHTSMNKLCISKLLQHVEGENVPGSRWDEKRGSRSISRVLSSARKRMDDHFSRKSVARLLQQPTRKSMADRTNPLSGWQGLAAAPALMLPV